MMRFLDLRTVRPQAGLTFDRLGLTIYVAVALRVAREIRLNMRVNQST